MRNQFYVKYLLLFIATQFFAFSVSGFAINNDVVSPSVVLEELNLDFEAELESNHTSSIEIEAYNLTEDIEVKLSGEDEEKFSYYFDENFDFRSGGLVFISYFPEQEEDLHIASLMFSSEGAYSKTIELRGVSRAQSAIHTPTEKLFVWTEKNKINFYAKDGDVVELISMMGHHLLQTTAVEGFNAIHIQARGVVILKVGDSIAKIIL